MKMWVWYAACLLYTSDEKALKAQCEQAFQVILSHVRLLMVAEGCHGDGRDVYKRQHQNKLYFVVRVERDHIQDHLVQNGLNIFPVPDDADGVVVADVKGCLLYTSRCV